MDKNKKSLEEDVIFEEENGSDPVKKLRERLNTAVKEKQEYLEGWQRAKADFVNYKKEEEQRLKSSSGFIKEKFISDLLPILDSFSEAKKTTEWNKGMESINDQLRKFLGDYGIEEIKELETFNPNFHESIEMIPTDNKEEDGLLEEILQVGYKMGDKVIRPAKVRVKIYQSK